MGLTPMAPMQSQRNWSDRIMMMLGLDAWAGCGLAAARPAGSPASSWRRLGWSDGMGISRRCHDIANPTRLWASFSLWNRYQSARLSIAANETLCYTDPAVGV